MRRRAPVRELKTLLTVICACILTTYSLIRCLSESGWLAGCPTCIPQQNAKKTFITMHFIFVTIQKVLVLAYWQGAFPRLSAKSSPHLLRRLLSAHSWCLLDLIMSICSRESCQHSTRSRRSHCFLRWKSWTQVVFFNVLLLRKVIPARSLKEKQREDVGRLDELGESVSCCKCPEVASGISALATIYQVCCTHPEGIQQRLNNYVYNIYMYIYTAGWWFGTFFIFPYIGIYLYVYTSTY